MQLMSLSDDKKKRKGFSASAIIEAEHIVSDQVPQNRRQEILEYLKLFGYKPDRTIIQVHLAGFFNKKHTPIGREAKMRQLNARKYGGTTFVVIGRTHDPALMNFVLKPKKKSEETSPGYIGYLLKTKDSEDRAPHDIIPLDFTPTSVSYPEDWKNMFTTKGFMLAMHVPSSFAKYKNRLTRELYRAGKSAEVRQPWKFIINVQGSSYEQMQRLENPVNILKSRLAKGEITKEEYERLLHALAA